MKKYILEVILFISGAVGMIFEITGSRVLAPYLGTSLPVWTSLIGIILGSLSLGYFLGGRLADKFLSKKTLSFVLAAAALFIGLTAISNNLVLFLLGRFVDNINLGAVIASLVLFAPAGIFLGIVSPYAIRLKLDSLDKSGSLVGRLYAISTVGSIVGTFAAGFWLIPFLGTALILYTLSLVMVLAALSVSGRKFFLVKTSLFAVLVVIFYASSAVGASLSSERFDIDTKYNRFWIYEKDYYGSPIRALRTDPFGIQAAVYLDNPDELVFDYLKFFRIAEHFRPEAKKALLIGGGVYTFPRDYIKRNPAAKIDAVEIDDRLSGIAKDYFFFRDDPRIKIINEDGRTFLNRNQEKYDHVFLDAFNSHISIPFQLTTKETAARVYDALNEDGVVVANIISGISGDRGKFLRAELATYKEVFPQIYLFTVENMNIPDQTQNLVLVAFKNKKEVSFESDNREFRRYLGNLWTEEIELDLPALTDDYAPVDFYTKDILK